MIFNCLEFILLGMLLKFIRQNMQNNNYILSHLTQSTAIGFLQDRPFYIFWLGWFCIDLLKKGTTILFVTLFCSIFQLCVIYGCSNHSSICLHPLLYCHNILVIFFGYQKRLFFIRHLQNACLKLFCM